MALSPIAIIANRLRDGAERPDCTNTAAALNVHPGRIGGDQAFEHRRWLAASRYQGPGRRQLVGAMTGDPVLTVVRKQRRSLAAAALDPMRTAQMAMAPRGRIDRARHVAGRRFRSLLAAARCTGIALSNPRV
jgi:hypothetical protein